jgi:DNA topoisomerase-1
MESWGLWAWPFSGLDLWERLRREAGDTGGVASWLPPSLPSDRRAGAQWPIFRTEIELAQYRQRARVLVETNAYAQGILHNLVNYIVGEGAVWEVSTRAPLSQMPPAQREEVLAVVRQAQDLLDHFCRINAFGSLQPAETLLGPRERELVRRVLRDGEAFLRLFPQPDGTLLVRWVEPEQIVNPAEGSALDGWSFGIQHLVWTAEDGQRLEDIETIVAYNVRSMGLVEGSVPAASPSKPGLEEQVDAAWMVHARGPHTDGTVKRGLPWFRFDVLDALERAAQLQRNVSLGATIRAATAEIWKFSYATQQQVASLAAALRQETQINPVTGATETIERVRPGMIRRLPAGQEPVPPPPDQSASFLTAVQGDLRQAATAFCAPENIASADASNNNYASLKEAGNPFVLAAHALQSYFIRVLAHLGWKALRYAARQGRLPETWLTQLSLQIRLPKVVVRDPLQIAQEDQIGVTMGWKDRKTCALERGLDWDQVLANNREYLQEMGPAAADFESLDQLLPSTEGRGQPCKPGERASVTGCIPQKHTKSPERADSYEPRTAKGQRFAGKAAGGPQPAAKEIRRKTQSKSSPSTAHAELPPAVHRRPAIRLGRMLPAKRVGNRWVTADGRPLPEHVQKVRIPAGLRNVTYSDDPRSEYVARGFDSKGREKRFYADSYLMHQAAAKFSRIRELLQKRAALRQEIEQHLAKGSEPAACALLILTTGIRPGSERDTRARTKAYGATTLEGRHVQVENGRVILDFIGKEGVHLRIPVEDPAVAKMLLARKERAGPNGKLFQTNDAQLRQFVASLDGGGFLTKDFRTALGTATALEMVRAQPTRAATMKEYKRRVKEVAEAVSRRLGNTPAMALKAYIDPTVFVAWSPQ